MVHATHTLLLGALLASACANEPGDPVRDGGGDGLHRADGRADGAGGDPRADAGGPACAAVTVEFVGEVATVSGTPLGLDAAARTNAVSGAFAYRPCAVDADPDDPRRGAYDHRGGGELSLLVAGRSINGSGSPMVEVQDLDPDTFRFRDGPQPLDEDEDLRVLEVDGERRPALTIRISFTDGSGAAFASDALPEQFPFLDLAEQRYPHTFAVQDGGGTLLLQLSSLTQL